ncbi:hypothetical protein [Pseudomonas oryzihabitans]|uniref:hypothetical protein n=1 Tax=Pseudomonas oryzihabitans TaxID=47885 RepID=UPI00115FF882|nr:hypothetical protein [Pseudomonas psychrotolerans]NMY89843.1 hypothetical protein [Pseudomonas psychrotolerans]
MSLEETELALHLIQLRSLNLEMAIENARDDPASLRRMIESLEARLAELYNEEEAALLRWAKAMLLIHSLKSPKISVIDS